MANQEPNAKEERLFIPENYPVQTFLADTNQLLMEINQSLKYLIKFIVNNNQQQEEPLSEKERLVRTIGGNTH